MANNIRWQFFVKWNNISFTEETSRVISIDYDAKMAKPGANAISSSGMVSRINVSLANFDGRYSSNNPNGFVYTSSGSYGKYLNREVYLDVSIDGGSNYFRIFSGVIVDIAESAPKPRQPSLANIVCHDYSALYMNRRVSTTIESFASLYNNTSTEKDVIEQFLSDVGLTSSNWSLDSGIFIIPFAWMDDESVIEEVWSIANACGGWFYNDIWDTSQPKFVYKNASHWNSQTISTNNPNNVFVRSSGHFTDLEMNYDFAHLFKTVTTEWAGRKIDAEDVIWEPENRIVVPANGTKTITAKFQYPIYQITTLDYGATTNGGLDISASVSHALGTEYAQSVDITFTNTHTTYAAVLRDVKLSGKAVIGGPDGETKTQSSHSYWDTHAEKNKSIRSNIWIQTEAHSNTLSKMYGNIHEAPAAYYSLKGIQGDPRRKLGQKVRIYDDATFDTTNEVGYIVELTARISKSGFRQDIVVVDSETLYDYIDSDPGYFIIDTNRISVDSSDSSTNRGRLFY